MKKADVRVGAIYAAKISGRITHVRLEKDSQYGGWDAINLGTKRSVRIHTAAKLRYEVLSNPRCGICNNCIEIKELKQQFTDRIRALKELHDDPARFHGTEAYQAILREWKVAKAPLSCTKGGAPK